MMTGKSVTTAQRKLKTVFLVESAIIKTNIEFIRLDIDFTGNTMLRITN